MKINTSKFVYLFTFIIYTHIINSQDLNLNKLLQPTSKQAVFRLENYMVWCGSPIKGKDGKFYLFYSRWPRNLTHQAWATHSEIAVAVSNKANGPYKHVKVILPKREKKILGRGCNT